jgi:hypothetical protein
MLVTVWLIVLVVTLVMRRAEQSCSRYDFLPHGFGFWVPDGCPLVWCGSNRLELPVGSGGKFSTGRGQVVLPMLYTDMVQQDCNGEGICGDSTGS